MLTHDEDAEKYFQLSYVLQYLLLTIRSICWCSSLSRCSSVSVQVAARGSRWSQRGCGMLVCSGQDYLLAVTAAAHWRHRLRHGVLLGMQQLSLTGRIKDYQSISLYVCLSVSPSVSFLLLLPLFLLLRKKLTSIFTMIVNLTLNIKIVMDISATRICDKVLDKFPRKLHSDQLNFRHMWWFTQFWWSKCFKSWRTECFNGYSKISCTIRFDR